jgi:NAD(P)H dehydrogenase (quinone)
MKTGISGATGQLGRLVADKRKVKISPANIFALVDSPWKAADLGV